MRQSCLIPAAALLALSALAAETWRWKDDRTASTHYSDQPGRRRGTRGPMTFGAAARHGHSAPAAATARQPLAARHRSPTPSCVVLGSGATTRPSTTSTRSPLSHRPAARTAAGPSHPGAAERQSGLRGMAGPAADFHCCENLFRGTHTLIVDGARCGRRTRSAPGPAQSVSTSGSRRCCRPAPRPARAPDAGRARALRHDGVARLLPSPLSHFEPTELFDSLSTGIVVLDAQLCLIYANVSAQDLMAVSVQPGARPAIRRTVLRSAAADSTCCAARSSDLETCTQHELVLKAVGSAAQPRSARHRSHRHAAGRAGHRHVPAARAHRCHAAPAHLARQRHPHGHGRQPAHGPPAGARGEESARRPARRRAAARSRAGRSRAARVHRHHHQRSRPADRAGRLDGRVRAAPPQQGAAEHPRDLRARGEADARRSAGTTCSWIAITIPSLPDGLFDRNQIVQALLNVARNAMQAVGQPRHASSCARACAPT